MTAARSEANIRELFQALYSLYTEFLKVEKDNDWQVKEAFRKKAESLKAQAASLFG